MRKCDQIRKFPGSHLLKKSLMENFIFCVMSDSSQYSERHSEKLKNFKHFEKITKLINVVTKKKSGGGSKNI